MSIIRTAATTTTATTPPEFFRRELPGGVVLVGEQVPDRRSLALGVWVGSGSRDERPGEEGSAHFVEHLVFKGTRTRSAFEIALSLERVGGSLDAFTTKETTCFYSRVLDEHLELAADVLADLVSRPRFAADDVDRERKVVLEELRSLDDNPEELIGDLAMAHIWPGHIMGASILGTEASLAGLDAGRVAAFHAGAYHGARTVVSAVGSVDPDRLAGLLESKLELPSRDIPAARSAPEPALSELVLYRRDASQLHLILHTGAPPTDGPDRHATQLLAEILGGGMSSRLFQAIREGAGLAYSVFSFSEHFEDCGHFGTSLAVSPDRAEEAMARTFAEMELLVRDGLREGELDSAKAQVRGALIMGEESLTNRMLGLARTEYRRREYESQEDRLARFESVTEDAVLAAARGILDPARQSLVALGPVTPEDLGASRFTRSRVIEETS